MEIPDNWQPTPPSYTKRRKKSSLGPIGYALSVVPAIILAFNFESFREWAIVRLGGQPQQQVQPQQPQQAIAQPAIQQPRRTKVTPASQHIVRQEPTPPARISRELDEELPRTPRRPVQMLPKKEVEQKPDYVFKLDFTKRRQIEPIKILGSGETLRFRGADTDRSKSTLSGTLSAGSQATLVLGDEFRPRIVVSHESKNGNDLICLEYLVDSAAGKEIPFTIKRLQMIRRKTVEDGSADSANLASLEAELARLKKWLETYSGKLWTEKRRAEIRVAELPGIITTQQQMVASLHMQLLAVERLIAIAESHNNSELYVFVERPIER